MVDRLGILLCTDKYLEHVVGLTKAAREAGKEVDIFVTADAVFLTQDPEFAELVKAGANIGLCDKSYKGFDLHKTYKETLEGVKHSTQDYNSEMATKVDRYVVF